MLLKEFLEPLGMTQSELARRIGVSWPRINELVNAKRGVTPDTALRLSKLFGNSVEFWLNGQRNWVWLNGQRNWDLWHAMRSPAAADIENIRPIAI
jgi:addiction module HigA family antidote